MRSFCLFLLLTLSLISCQEEKVSCRDNGKAYQDHCDQGHVYQAALEQAKEKKKILVVKFGANWCAWCVSLHKYFKGDEKFRNEMKDFEFVSIATYKEKEKLQDGLGVLKKMREMAVNPDLKQDGIPFLVVVDPERKNSFLQNTVEFEKNTKTTRGHDMEKVKAFLKATKSRLKNQS